LTSIVTGYSEAVKTRMEGSAPVSTDFTEHSVISFKCLEFWKNDVKVVKLNELFIPYHVSSFLLCALLWNMNKVWFQHKIKYVYISFINMNQN